MNKKLFRTCRYLLLAAVAVQLAGCARHRTWVSAGFQQQKDWVAKFPLFVEDTPVVARIVEPTPATGIASQDSKKTPELLATTPGLLDPISDDHLEGDIVQSSAQGDQKQGSARSSAGEPGSQVQKSSSKPEAIDDLADLENWESDGEVAAEPVVTKRAASTPKPIAASSNKKAAHTPEPIQRRVEPRRNDLTPVSAVGSTRLRSGEIDLLALCPEAKGDLRDQIHALNTSDLEVLKHRLGRLGNDTAAAPALEHLLKHKDSFVKMHAAFALARMQKSTPEGMRIVVDGLKSNEPGLRTFAAATIAEMGPQLGVALEAFADTLESRDRDGNYRFEDAEVLIRVRSKRPGSSSSQTTAKNSATEKATPVPAKYRLVEAVEPSDLIEQEQEQEVAEVVEEVMETNDETAQVDEEAIELEAESTIVRPRIQRTSGTSEGGFPR